MAVREDFSMVRRARILLLLEASESAGLTPIPVSDLHAFAYLANVLSPVWDLAPQKRTVFKKRGNPYYPELQHGIDTLVGRGIIGIEGLEYRLDVDDRWRLEGRLFLADFEAARIITDTVQQFADEQRLASFYRELAFAYAALPWNIRSNVVEEDAIYGIDVGDDVLIDFAEWKQANYSENSARFFDRVMPDGQAASPAQKLHLYAQHLKWRLVKSD